MQSGDAARAAIGIRSGPVAADQERRDWAPRRPHALDASMPVFPSARRYSETTYRVVPLLVELCDSASAKSGQTLHPFAFPDAVETRVSRDHHDSLPRADRRLPQTTSAQPQFEV